MFLSSKDLLQKLVQIPSVNPAFQSDERSETGEGNVTRFLETFFSNLGLPWARQGVHPGRDNILVVYRGMDADTGPMPVLWEVHQDTVGVAGMKIDPYAATESEGRIWGRGACDVKGGMAAMLAALARLVEEQVQLPQTLVVAMTINEECGFSGIKSLCRLWGTETEAESEAKNLSGPLTFDEIRALRPQQSIVAEPTLLDVVVAHKGSVRWRCHTRGKAVHTSRPEQGVNAITGMTYVVQAIQKFNDEVLSQREAHPLCGRPTVCVSTIEGGSGANTVPDHTVIGIDRRLMPGETAEGAYQELVSFVAAQSAGCAATIEHEQPYLQSVGLEDANNRVWAKQVADVAGTLGQTSRLIGVPYGTDAWALSAIGIPSVVFGPGSIDQAHTEDEWIDIEQLEHATEIFYRLACGGAK